MSLLKQGNEAFRKRDYKKAIELYEKVGLQNPAMAELVKVNLSLAILKAKGPNTTKVDTKFLSVPKVNSRDQTIEYAPKDHSFAHYLMNHQIFKVDIVIPVYNALEDVKLCLESVEKHTDNFRVTTYIVNDGSGPETSNFLRWFCEGKSNFVLIEHDKNMMYTRTVNDGLRASTGDYVITLNSDTIVSQGWLRGLVRCIRSEKNIGIVGPLSNAASWQNVPYLFDENNQFAVNSIPNGMSVNEMGTYVSQVSNHIYPCVPFVNGFCFMIAREVIDKIGYLDEETFPTGYGEENDYCLRAADAGFTLAIADNSYVFHAKSKSFGHVKRKEYSRNGSEALKNKHGSSKVSALVNRLKESAELDMVRERLVKPLSSRSSPCNFSNIKILFLLPVNGGGGGAHSVVQEVQAMRQVGVKVQIAMKPQQVIKFINDYPEIKESKDIFVDYKDDNELLALAGNFDVVIATVYTTVKALKNIVEIHPHILPAYYIQDYEPMFFDKFSPNWGEAYQSYTLIDNCFMFAKTDWIINKVQHIHGVEVSKVEPSIDHAVYHPFGEKQKDKIIISAMIRPKTPYRGASRTMNVLHKIQKKHKDKVEILLFGSEETDPLFKSLNQHFDYRCKGILTRKGVAEVLQKSDIFVDLSDYQAFGRTALEAMACCCTAVETHYGGVHEYAVDGENCLLVDSFDETAAFNAINELINNPDKLVTFQNSGLVTASKYSPHRAALSELEHIAKKLQIYRHLRPKNKKPVLYLMPSMRDDGKPAGSGYVRVVLPYRSKFLQQHMDVKILPTKLPEPGSGKFALIQRDAANFSLAELKTWMPAWKSKGGVLIFEIDDDLLNKKGLTKRGYKKSFEQLKEKVSFLAENADMITVSTAPLKAKMSAFNKNVVVVPNCLDADIWQLYKDRDHTSGPFARNPSGPIKIGYIGTNTHQEDLEVIAGAMNQIKDKYGSKVEIEVIGAFQNHPVKFGNRVALPKNTDYPSFVEWLLKRVHWDIGVIPLVDDDFNKSKSNLKFLEYAALDMAIVASRHSVYEDIAKEASVFSVSDEKMKWFECLDTLIRSAELRLEQSRSSKSVLMSKYQLLRLDLFDIVFKRFLA